MFISAKNSWLVSYRGPYGNERPAHVEVGQANMKNYKSGQTFYLSNLHRLGNAVMWDVNGCRNGRHTAHFTVYYGSDAKAKMPKLL